MNHNNQIRASRLYAETNQFADSLGSKIGRKTSSEIRVSHFQDRIREVIDQLPTERGRALARFMDEPMSEIVLSYQDGSKLDRLLREWAEIVQSEEAHISERLRDLTNMVRPVIEELRACLIERIQARADRKRQDCIQAIDEYVNDIVQFQKDHPGFAAEADEALRVNPDTSKLRIDQFKSVAEQQPVTIDLNGLLEPFEKAIRAEVKHYDEMLNQRARAAWGASTSLKRLTWNTRANTSTAVE